MNKKAIELSITQLIGFVIAVVIFLGTIGLVMKIVGIMSEKPDEASTNSFKNLMHEINTIEDGQKKVVPYYIQENLYLNYNCEITPNQQPILDDLCLCKTSCYKKRLQREFHKDKYKLKITSGKYITYDQGKDVKNLAIIRKSNDICITEDTTATQCVI